jgi:hypothetical protein
MNKSIIFIIDTSYSVNHILTKYVNSINNIINLQLAMFPETKYTICTFNNNHNFLCINEKLSSTNRRLTIEDLKPNGFTALYDSVSAVLIHMDNFFRINNSEPPIVIIITDGDDTASKLLNRKHLFLQIARNKSRGWKFIFMGITEDSLTIGKDIGSDISIMYNTSEDCFSNLHYIFREIFSNPKLTNVEINMNDLTNNMSNLKI